MATFLKPGAALLAAFPIWFFLGVRAHADDAVQPQAIRVACIGDSITAGAYIPDPAKESYPAVLGRWLGIGYRVRNFGVSGTTLLKNGDHPYWKTPDYSDAKLYLPNIIIIMLGTNDTKPQNWRYKDQFEADYSDFVQQFEALPSHPTVYVCLPAPVVGNGNDGISEPGVLDEIPMIKAVAADLKVKQIDVYAVLNGRGELMPDNIHPNAAGAKLIAGAVYEKLTGFIPPPEPIR